MSRIKSQIGYYDLTGGLNNVSTPDTLNSTPKKTESPDMVNVEFFKLGGLKSMNGNAQIGDTKTSRIVGGWEYVKNNNKYMIIATFDGELYMYNPVTEKFDYDAIDSENGKYYFYKFPNKSSRVSFCNMNNGVVATNGVDDPIFYERGRHTLLSGSVSTTADSTAVTGSSTEFETELNHGDRIDIDGNIYIVDEITNNTHMTITEPALTTVSDKYIYLSTLSQCNATLTNTDSEAPDDWVDKPIRGNAIQFYAGRLWIGGKSGLFYSQLGQYNKWNVEYDAGEIAEVYNDTSEVKALGLYSDYMLIHKEFNTYLLTLTGVANGTNSTLSIKPYSNVSCDSQQSWIVSNTKYYVYSRENMDIYPLSQRTIFSDRYLGEAITNKVRNIFLNLRDSDADKIFCVTLPSKRWMIFYLPLVDQLGSGCALIYDFQCKAFVTRRVPQDVSIAFNYDNKVYIGTEDGKVLQEFVGDTFDGQPIIAYFRSPWFDWSGDYMQSFAEFAIDMCSEYHNQFYIRTYKDGDSPFEDREIDDGALLSGGLIWDGGEYEPEYNYILKSHPVPNTSPTEYNLIVKIPKIDSDANADTVITVDDNVFFTSVKDDDDLIIKQFKLNSKNEIVDETTVQTISDYFKDGYNIYIDGHIDGNNTTWDNDVWTSGSFNSIRMLLPNNVFESFQLEIGTNKLGQAFSIYGFNFRRVETEETPW